MVQLPALLTHQLTILRHPSDTWTVPSWCPAAHTHKHMQSTHTGCLHRSAGQQLQVIALVSPARLGKATGLQVYLA
jgi:hypothetical protein